MKVPAPTPDQKRVLDDAISRIRVVRAAPGSGKTWLVAEDIRRHLGSAMLKSTQGIAALSFTRVGGDEIRAAVGCELGHPHFVGTLDAFLFRYVVRPFARKTLKGFGNPVLMPADWQPNSWAHGRANSPWTIRCGSGTSARTYNWFDINYALSADGTLKVTHPGPYGGPAFTLRSDDAKAVMDSKVSIWQSSGFVTHADASYLASRMLGSKRHGGQICKLLAERFPYVVIDELQDTGQFLGAAIRTLLNGHAIRALLVGDPDQAIYEFNGAHPELFDTFEMLPCARPFTLGTSTRCPQSITEIAKHVKHRPGPLTSASNAIGRAFLIGYGTGRMIADLDVVVRATVARRELVKVVARANATVLAIQAPGATARAKPPRLACPAGHHLLAAVTAFHDGRTVRAKARAKAALGCAIFDNEAPTATDLASVGISDGAWDLLARQILLDAIHTDTSIDSWAWQTGAVAALTQRVQQANLSQRAAMVVTAHTPQKRPGHDLVVAAIFLTRGVTTTYAGQVEIQSVHGVKGETHDATIFVIPEAAKQQQCPSNQWWPVGGELNEEARIAYVAMTRTRGDLLLLVPEATLARFRAKRPGFVALFETVTASAVYGPFAAADDT